MHPATGWLFTGRSHPATAACLLLLLLLLHQANAGAHTAGICAASKSGPEHPASPWVLSMLGARSRTVKAPLRGSQPRHAGAGEQRQARGAHMQRGMRVG